MKKNVFSKLILASSILLASSASYATTVLTDSIADFSGTQGLNNWYYGYFDTSSSNTAFTEMTQFDSSSGQATWYRDNGVYWTQLWASGGHPNGLSTGGGRISDDNSAVRRWVSQVSGIIDISGLIRQGDSGQTTETILVDGVNILTSSSTRNGTYDVSATVHVGSTIDFAIAPSEPDFGDSTQFTAHISAVPEPAPFLLMGLGTLALMGVTYSQKKRNR